MAVVLAFSLGVLALLIWIYLPPMFEQALLSTAAAHAEKIGLSTAYQAGSDLQAGRIDNLEAVLEAARQERDLYYLVVTDAAGRVQGAVNLPGARRARYKERISPGRFDHEGVLYQTGLPLTTEGGLPSGHLYLGLSIVERQATLGRYRRLTGGFCLLLLVTALGLVAGAHRFKRLTGAHRRLAQRHTELQTDIDHQRKNRVEVAEVEAHYQGLFENAMAVAYKDLEKLAQDLKQQKNNLIREVAERKRAEVALRRHTERLKALNEIERNMLGNEPTPAIARLALRRLAQLVPYTCAYVIEFDYVLGEGAVLAAEAGKTPAPAAGERLPLHTFARVVHSKHDKIRYVKDLTRVATPSPLEQILLEGGIRSCFYVPLVGHDEIVGKLVVGADGADGFTREQAAIAREVADLLALSIRQTRLNAERELYEGELIAAKEQAEEMARLKSTFLTNMTHEIRTPLTGIIGFAQVLYDEAESEHREFAKLIENDARRLLDTINAVLDLARLESGRIKLALKPLNVAYETEQAANLLMPLAARKGLILAVQLHQRDAWCNVDEACFSRILNILIGNAIKFTKQGEVRLSVDADEENVYVEVKDTGIGIDEVFLPHLFEEFRQEESGSDRSHEGAGLGLTITNKLVGRMGGDISVDSEKGRGSTFTVRFPRYQHEHPKAPH